MGLNKILIILFLLVILSFCTTPALLNKMELEKHLTVPSNGFLKEISDGQMKLEICFRPTELVWYNDLNNLTVVAKDSLLEDFENRYYFIASYSSKQDSSLDPLSQLVGNKKLYNEVLSNLAFQFHNYAKLVLENGEEIHSIGSVFSKSYGMMPYNHVLFYFEDPRITESSKIYLTIADIGFGVNINNLEYSVEDLKTVPKLMFNNHYG